MDTVENESRLYEKLNDTASLRGFIIAAVSLFEEAVDSLINRVFLKTDFAVKSVVDSLLYQSGPLFELPIRLKVLLGLGVISHEVFADINGFLQLKEQLNNDEKEYAFYDERVLAFCRHLSHQKTDIPTLSLPEDPESLLFQVNAARQEKLIRSCLILAISDIYTQLQIESPL